MTILRDRDDDNRAKFTARKAGAVLSALGMKIKRIGNQGYGLIVNSSFRKKVYQLALDLGLDRRVIVNIEAINAGNCGERHLLCEEFALTAGLRGVVPKRRPPRSMAEYCVGKRLSIFTEGAGDVPDQHEEWDSARKAA